jgi:YHS domain-containing protein
MKGLKMKIQNVILPLIIFSILILFIPGGCKKQTDSPSGDGATSVQAKEIYTCSMHPDYTSDKPGICPECKMKLVKKVVEQPAAQIEQKMCPVMTDMKINPEIFTEYKGKKVYFCCTDCKAKFEVEPEKYVANLPQFKN